MTPEVATTWMLLFWVRATVILLLGGAIALLLRRSSSSARHAVLGLTVGALLVLPVGSSVLPRWEIAILPGTSPRTEAIRTRAAVAESVREARAPRSLPARADRSAKATAAVTSPSGDAVALSDVRDPSKTPEDRSSRMPVGSAVAWLVVAWLAGAAIGVVQIARSSLRVQRTLRRAAELAEPGWQGELAQAARTLGLQRGVRLLMSDAVRVPVVHGFRRPAIVVPTTAAQWPEDRRRAFLLHELAHVRRQDWPVQMLGHLVRALYWPHPLVWWVVRRLRAEAERACDDCVLLAGTSASDYADHLLEAARDLGRTPPQVMLAAVERSYFEDRLIALLDPQVSRRALGPRLFVCAAVAALAIVVGLAGLQPVARVLAAAPERAASKASVSSPKPGVRSSPGTRTASDPASPARATTPAASSPGAPLSSPAAGKDDSGRAADVVPAADADEPEAPSEDEAESEEGVATLPVGQAVPLPQPSAAPAAMARPVIRISTDLVQIDAVITDKDGKAVVDLRPEDFEVFEDGKKQNVTVLRYVAAGPATVTGSGTSSPAAQAGEPRSFVFVIDNLGLSLEGVVRARRMMQSFVTSGLQPRDRAAIIETSATKGGTFALTSDRKVLSAAADRIHYKVGTRADLGSFPDRELDLTSRHSQLVMESLAVVKNSIDALRALPGRKSVIVVSDGFVSRISVDVDRLLQRYTAVPLDSVYGDTSLYAAMRALTDLANRASVVIYTLDSTGLQTSSGGGQRQITGSPRNATNTATVGDVRNDDGQLVAGNSASREFLVRSAARTAREDSLIEIAEQTGGLAVFSTNDLTGGLARIVDDLSGYYLIGYVPEQATFEQRPGPPRFHTIKVEVKRSGLKVRSRKGFYGVTDELVAQASPPQ